MNTKSLLYLWSERTLFLGRLDDPIALSQGAATLTISLEGPLSLIENGNNSHHECTSVLLPAGCQVSIDTRRHLIANINLDVMGVDYCHLKRAMKNELESVSTQIEQEEKFSRELKQLAQNAPSSDQAKQILNTLISSAPAQKSKCDTRIEKIVRLIQDSIGENLSIEYLADQASLSVAGLTKLFKKQTGVPIRRYRQWHRLYVTATEIGNGKNLTDAAQSAGFVDLPHCTHTFNLMFGMKPSYFLLRPDTIRVITEASKCARGISTPLPELVSE